MNPLAKFPRRTAHFAQAMLEAAKDVALALHEFLEEAREIQPVCSTAAGNLVGDILGQYQGHCPVYHLSGHSLKVAASLFSCYLHCVFARGTFEHATHNLCEGTNSGDWPWVSNRMHPPRYWQMRAEELRTKADNAAYPHLRETLRNIAKTYDDLASAPYNKQRSRDP